MFMHVLLVAYLQVEESTASVRSVEGGMSTPGRADNQPLNRGLSRGQRWCRVVWPRACYGGVKSS